MRQRLAIAVSSLVAAGVLAVGLSAAGFGPGAQPAAGEEPDVATVQETAPAVAEAAEPEVVYVEPAPKAKTVVKVKRVQATGSGTAERRTAPVRSVEREDEHEEAEHRSERRETREHEHEHEGDDD
jgi:hypothetical protein